MVHCMNDVDDIITGRPAGRTGATTVMVRRQLEGWVNVIFYQIGWPFNEDVDSTWFFPAKGLGLMARSCERTGAQPRIFWRPKETRPQINLYCDLRPSLGFFLISADLSLGAITAPDNDWKYPIWQINFSTNICLCSCHDGERMAGIEWSESSFTYVQNLQLYKRTLLVTWI